MYSLFIGNLNNNDRIGSSSNKDKLVKTASRLKCPATIVNNYNGNIVFENDAQKIINNGGEIK